MLWGEIPAVLAITRNTLRANLAVRLLALGVICLLVLVWTPLTTGELPIAPAVYDPGREDPGPD